MGEFKITKAEGGAAFAVRVVPRAGKTEIAGIQGGALKVRIAAPPVGGAANEALLKFLANILKVRTSALEIVAGTTSQQKMICVIGLTPQEVESRLLG
jgi:uncharacterized protein (TIGR00251 family)